jgi:uncharacterized protein
MLSDNIQKQIGDAMKARDEVRLSTLRMLSSALNYEKIAKQRDLSDEEELAVVKREAKKRLDAIEAYGNAEGKHLNQQVQTVEERKKKEEEELAILKEYLPEEIADDELEKYVEEAIAQTNASAMSDVGKVIGAVMAKAKGRADGKTVAELVKSKLSQ